MRYPKRHPPRMPFGGIARLRRYQQNQLSPNISENTGTTYPPLGLNATRMVQMRDSPCLLGVFLTESLQASGFTQILNGRP